MIRHIVLFRFKPEIVQPQIDELMRTIECLQTQACGMLEVEHGADFGGRGDGFSHVATARFNDRTSLSAFYASAGHNDLVETLIGPLAEKVLVLDFDSSSDQCVESGKTDSHPSR